jgi:chromosome segregation ATPase
MDVETELVDLKRRLTLLENEVKTDRELPVRLFSYVREMRDDIGLLRSHAMVTEGRIGRLEERMERVEQRLERVEQRLDKVEQRLDKVEKRLDRVESELASLRSEFSAFRKELPAMIAETMREVLREHRSR